MPRFQRRTVARTIATLLLAWLTPPGSAAAALIAITGDRNAADSILYQVDLSTGNATQLYGTGIKHITGIAFHPTTGVLYAHQNENDTLQGNLYRIDTASRTTQLIGSTGKNVTDLTFTPDGTLYGWTGGINHPGPSPGLLNDLVTIDLVTGALSYVGDSGLNVTNRAGLASDSSGNLFLKVGNEAAPSSGNGTIYSLDTMNGAATNPVPTGLATNSLAIDPDTGLAYTMDITAAGSTLKTIDLASGVLTPKANSVPAKFTALAFGNVTAVPEPSSLAVLAASIAPLLVRLRKRRAPKCRRPAAAGRRT